MRKTVRSLAIGACVASAVLGNIAAAETEAEELKKMPEVISTADVNLSLQQQVTRGQAILNFIDQSRDAISERLRAARKSRDVVKVLCLSDKVSQVNVGSRSATDRFDALKNAADAKDKDQARHEYNVLEVLNERVRTLLAEANQCVGEETNFQGSSDVTVEVDPNLPTDNSIPGGDGSSGTAANAGTSAAVGDSATNNSSNSVAGDSGDLSTPGSLNSPTD